MHAVTCVVVTVFAPIAGSTVYHREPRKQQSGSCGELVEKGCDHHVPQVTYVRTFVHMVEQKQTEAGKFLCSGHSPFLPLPLTGCSGQQQS